MHTLLHWLATLWQQIHGPPLTGPRLVVPIPLPVVGDGARLEIGLQDGRPALRLAFSTHHDVISIERYEPLHRVHIGPGPFGSDALDDDPFDDAQTGCGHPSTPCLYEDTEDDGLPF